MKKIKSIIKILIILVIITSIAYLSYTYLGSGNWMKRFESELDHFFGRGNWEYISDETKESIIYEEYHYSSNPLYSTSTPGKYKDWYISVTNEQGKKELWRITNHTLKINHNEYGIFSEKRLSNKQAFVMELFDIACIEAGNEVIDEILRNVLSEEEIDCFRVEISYEGGNPEPEFYDKLWKEEWFTAKNLSVEKFLACDLYDFYIDIYLYDYRFEQLSEEQQEHILENYDVIKEMLLEKYGNNASFQMYFGDEATEENSDNPYDFTICFAGDINLDENWSTTIYMDKQPGGIKDCISEELLQHMQDADIMCLNNEFTYSTNGEPMAGKAYCFRAKPERVEILKKMGVDVVKLANNHAYDYGSQSLLDTMETLENAGIEYIGAGRNLEEAMTPVYIELDGKTVAFVAASRAEKNIMTPQATEDSAGILRCYDTTLFMETIKEAKANADFVLAYVHWGTEYSYELEDVQLATGKEYLDAGADVVIGAHSHCLQGMEYYNGKPIIYSLGNYWFNEKTLDTMLIDLHFSGDDTGGQIEVKIIPAIQSEYKTTIVKEKEEQERIYSFLEEISINIEIDENGSVTQIPDEKS